MKLGIEHAIRALHPDAQFTMVNDDITEWHSPDIVQPLGDEIDAKIRELQQLEPYRLLRIERDRRLQATDWRASSDLTISGDWKAHRQDLRDLPAQQTPKLNSDGELDPTSISWPPEPSS